MKRNIQAFIALSFLGLSACAEDDAHLEANQREAIEAAENSADPVQAYLDQFGQDSKTAMEQPLIKIDSYGDLDAEAQFFDKDDLNSKNFVTKKDEWRLKHVLKKCEPEESYKECEKASRIRSRRRH